MAMDAEGQLRNLRDFLLVYNRMTETCFQRCSTNFNYRNLTMDEERCVDSCAGKLIRSNHRLMGTYVKLMPAMVQRRMEEMESKAAELAKASAETQPLSLGTASTPSSELTVSSSNAPEAAAGSATFSTAAPHGVISVLSDQSPQGLSVPEPVTHVTSGQSLNTYEVPKAQSSLVPEPANICLPETPAMPPPHK